MTFFPSLADDASLLDIYRGRSEYFKHWVRGTQQLMRGESELTPGEREAIAAYVSALNACDFCVGGHRAAAAALGFDPDLMDALIEDIDTAPIDAKMKPIFHLAGKLTLTPARTVQGDADAIYDAGWSERAFFDVVLVTCTFNFMNRLVDGTGVPLAADQIAARAEMFREHGYKFPGIYVPEEDPA